MPCPANELGTIAPRTRGGFSSVGFSLRHRLLGAVHVRNEETKGRLVGFCRYGTNRAACAFGHGVPCPY
jgi:hypothetical protein